VAVIAAFCCGVRTCRSLSVPTRISRPFSTPGFAPPYRKAKSFPCRRLLVPSSSDELLASPTQLAAAKKADDGGTAGQPSSQPRLGRRRRAAAIASSSTTKGDATTTTAAASRRRVVGRTATKAAAAVVVGASSSSFSDGATAAFDPVVRATSTATASTTPSKGTNAEKEQQKNAAAERTTESLRSSLRPQKTRKKPNAKYFLQEELLDHELLTMDEEQRLGKAIRRAQELRAALDALVGVKHEREEEEEVRRRRQQLQKLRGRQRQNRRRQQKESDDERDLADLLFLGSQQQAAVDAVDDDEEEEDLSHLSVYGIDKYFSFDSEIERNRREFLARQEEERAGRELDYSFGSDGELNPVLPYSLDQKISLLTDAEIESAMGLKGGRVALREALVAGSLARETLIKRNFKLVFSISKQWARNSARSNDRQTPATVFGGSWDRPSLDEAVQEGVVGLAVAVDRYDPDRKLRFSTYATWWVTNYVRRCFQTASVGCVRVPQQFHEIKSKFNVVVKHYVDTEGKVPSIDVIAKEIGVKLPRLETVLLMTQPRLSIDTPIRRVGYMAPGKAGGGMINDDSLSYADTIVDATDQSPEERVELSFLRQNLEHAMASELAPYERDIIRLRLGLDDGVRRTVRQVAQEFGGALSVGEIMNGERRAYNKLRSPYSLKTYRFLSYLDVADVDESTVSLK